MTILNKLVFAFGALFLLGLGGFSARAAQGGASASGLYQFSGGGASSDADAATPTDSGIGADVVPGLNGAGMSDYVLDRSIPLPSGYLSSAKKMALFKDAMAALEEEGIEGEVDPINPTLTMMVWKDKSGSYTPTTSITFSLNEGVGFWMFCEAPDGNTYTVRMNIRQAKP